MTSLNSQIGHVVDRRAFLILQLNATLHIEPLFSTNRSPGYERHFKANRRSRPVGKQGFKPNHSCASFVSSHPLIQKTPSFLQGLRSFTGLQASLSRHGSNQGENGYWHRSRSIFLLLLRREWEQSGVLFTLFVPLVLVLFVVVRLSLQTSHTSIDRIYTNSRTQQRSTK